MQIIGRTFRIPYVLITASPHDYLLPVIHSSTMHLWAFPTICSRMYTISLWSKHSVLLFHCFSYGLPMNKDCIFLLERYLFHCCDSITTSKYQLILGLKAAWVVDSYRFLDYPFCLLPLLLQIIKGQLSVCCVCMHVSYIILYNFNCILYSSISEYIYTSINFHSVQFGTCKFRDSWHHYVILKCKK
jgi:hypothetical protein